ncbi:helix-turn-helix domain-containing protein [Paraburkholderia ginsengisoli]|nr:helix-turn-helix domain-containing protein [Paraburkholderia ginsengisoli]
MLTTAELAELLRLSPKTLYKRFCQNGHVFGVKPIKLSPGRGGRLLWPADSLAQIAGNQ